MNSYIYHFQCNNHPEDKDRAYMLNRRSDELYQKFYFKSDEENIALFNQGFNIPFPFKKFKANNHPNPDFGQNLLDAIRSSRFLG